MNIKLIDKFFINEIERLNLLAEPSSLPFMDFDKMNIFCSRGYFKAIM